MGINPVCCIGKRFDNRYTPIKSYKEYKIDINGRKNIDKYLSVLGFKNYKHINRYNKWNKLLPR